jgi:hypothetical protein
MMSTRSNRSVIACAAKRPSETNKTKLERIFKSSHFGSDYVISTMLTKTTNVYDVTMDIDTSDPNASWIVRILPDKPTDVAAYMTKLDIICNVLDKWGALDTFSDALDGLTCPVTSSIDIDLGLGVNDTDV